ncbi:phosphatidylinositol-specific phospholipase C domain-containing protein, partial [Enterococcus faecalis]|uniref:phosphatidylinositol-specific phospholipase C domain-containing protein n=1 Tax=Enterococcus faecalis TaxID=1351 RepID=UPI001A9593B1
MKIKIIFSIVFIFLLLTSHEKHCYAEEPSINSNDQIPSTSWMKYCIQDQQYIGEINIPGTHDSTTYKLNGISTITEPWSKTQDWTITDQLNHGIRYLDFRIYDDLSMHHGVAWVGENLEYHLNEVISFLKNNPEEFVIIRLKSEQENSNATILKQNLTKLLFQDKIYPYLATGIAMNSKVYEVRGKILLLDNTSNVNPFNSGINWGQIKKQDNYSPSSKEEKWDSIKKGLENKQITINDISANHISYTLGIESLRPLADWMNNRLYECLVNDSKYSIFRIHHLGFIIMDFPTDELIHQIILRNLAKPINLSYSTNYLNAYFNATYESGGWGECYKVTGIKEAVLSEGTRITLPSMVFDSSDSTKSYPIQISQEFWDDIKNKPQSFKDRIKTFQIKEQGGYKITSFGDKDWDLSFLFGEDQQTSTEGYRNLVTAQLEGLDFSTVNNMKAMFQDNLNLQSVDTENWNVKKVTDTSFMFNGTGIKKADLSPWWIAPITTMESMFQNTPNLEEVYLGQAGGNPWKVSNMKNMFFNTPNLKYVDTEKWRIDNLSSTQEMFGLSGIEKINLSTWNPSQTGINMLQMFEGTDNLRVVDMRGFTNLDSQTTTKLIGIYQAANPIMLIVQDNPGNKAFVNFDFKKESGRIPIPMPLLKTSNEQLKLTDGSTESAYITTIPVVPSTLEKTTFDAWLQKQTPQSKVIGNNFYYVKDVTPSKDVSSASSVLDLLDVTYTVNVVESEWEFKYDSTDGTYELVQYLGTSPDIVVPNEIDGKPTKIDLHAGIICAYPLSVTSITFDSSNGKKVKAIGNSIYFNLYEDLTTFDGRGLDTSNIKVMHGLFYGNSKLKTVNLSGWDTSSVKDMERAFQGCSSLTSLDLSTWDVSSVTTMGSMFQGTSSLTSLDLSAWDTSSLEDAWWMFAWSGVEKLDLNNFNIDKLHSVSYMFGNARSLKELSIDTWAPKKTQINMSIMFEGTHSLRKVDMRGFTNLDSQITTDLLGTSQAANPIVLIVQDSSGNTNFLNRDFVKESGRSVYSEFPKLVANGGKFEDNSNELSYIKKICVTPE